MVIAEKIIDQNPNEKFYTMVMSYVKNEKFEHYFNRLKEGNQKRAYSFYMESPEPNLCLYLFIRIKTKSLLLPEELKTIYLANMDKPEIHTVVVLIQRLKLKPLMMVQLI